MKQYKISGKLSKQLIDHCLQTPEVEVCGMIGSDADGRQSLYRIDNIADDPAHAFFMDPKSQISAMRQMREAGQKIQAIYHSHPTTAAEPSEADIRLAAYPGVYYLIVSLQSDQTVLKAFLLNDQSYSEVPLKFN